MPAKALSLPGTHQVPPHLLLHPILDEAEAPTRIPDSKVVHPPTQNRIDEVHHPFDGLGLKASENILEPLQQCRSRLQLGHVIRPPDTSEGADATERKAQEAEALPFGQV